MSGAFTFICGSLLFGYCLFGVSEPKLTEKPPPMNPKNHKYLWLILLYTYIDNKSICDEIIIESFISANFTNKINAPNIR